MKISKKLIFTFGFGVMAFCVVWARCVFSCLTYFDLHNSLCGRLECLTLTKLWVSACISSWHVMPSDLCACSAFVQHNCTPGRHVATLALSAVSSTEVQEGCSESLEEFTACKEQDEVSEILDQGCKTILTNKSLDILLRLSDTRQSGKTCLATWGEAPWKVRKWGNF